MTYVVLLLSFGGSGTAATIKLTYMDAEGILRTKTVREVSYDELKTGQPCALAMFVEWPAYAKSVSINVDTDSSCKFIAGWLVPAKWDFDIGQLRIHGTPVITHDKQLINVDADASIITSGTLALDRLPTIPYSKTDFADQDLRTSATPDFSGLKISGTEVLDASRNLKNVGTADVGSLKVNNTEVISSDRVLKNIKFGYVRECKASGAPPQSDEITPTYGGQFLPIYASAQAGTTVTMVGAADIIKLLTVDKRIVKLKAETNYDGRDTTARVIAVDEDNNEIVLCSAAEPGLVSAVASARAYEV